MQAGAYAEFMAARDDFAGLVEKIDRRAPWLGALQDRLRIEMGYDDYRVETPVVYNRDLDAIGPDSDPPFILVADNPGKMEQKNANRRYLVGQSGKLAAGWFSRELNLDFRAATLIVNKTPLHTPKTAELRRLIGLAGPHREELVSILEDSQRSMARLAYRMHAAMGNTVWVSGYGELKPRGLFRVWAEEIVRLYDAAPRGLAERVWVFRHFSMNQFSIEYNSTPSAEANPAANGPKAAMAKLAIIGTANRKRILGF
ncbi:MAG: hypothetical protein WAZ99_00155 [Rectinemataceae bacterium]